MVTVARGPKGLSRDRAINVLITGGCGFIGANLIARLHQERSSALVRVIDNESRGKREWIDEFDVEFVSGDIRDPEAVARALDGIDTVVHLAADTGVVGSVANPSFNFDVNVVGTVTLLEQMRRVGVTRIVNASTGGAIVGEAIPPINEDMLARPTAPYGAAKLAVEGYLAAYTASLGFDAVSLRFSNVYGRRSYHKGSAVAAFLKRIVKGEPITFYGDGSQTRDYVFADDLCDGIFKAMQACPSGVYQLGTGVGTSLNDLVEIIEDLVGPDYPIRIEFEDFRQGELLHTWCDISKAKAAFDYSPRFSLREGIAETWAWFRNLSDRR